MVKLDGAWTTLEWCRIVDGSVTCGGCRDAGKGTDGTRPLRCSNSTTGLLQFGVQSVLSPGRELDDGNIRTRFQARSAACQAKALKPCLISVHWVLVALLRILNS